MRLWRPVGKKELDLIIANGMRAFPPRLPEQPIFYPVLSFDYAEKIARDWNSTDAGHDFLGYVTAFKVADQAAGNYPVQEAGGAAHRELWVPAEDLENFNAAIEGPILVVAAYRKGRCISPGEQET